MHWTLGDNLQIQRARTCFPATVSMPWDSMESCATVVLMVAGLCTGHWATSSNYKKRRVSSRGVNAEVRLVHHDELSVDIRKGVMPLDVLLHSLKHHPH